MARGYSRVLVTGGAGFIGSHIVDSLLNEGFEVAVVDSLETGRLENLAQHQGRKELHFIKGDIRNYSMIEETLDEVDAVFHEAALVSVALSVEDPILTNDVNVTGTLNLLKASLDLGVKRFVYASSAAVYGDTSYALKKEDMIPNPTSPYAVSKFAAENYVRLFHELYGMETVSLRYFNAYGPRQTFDIHSAYGSVMTVFINRLLKNMPLIIYGDGEQTRDFVYIKDIVNANMLALKSNNVAGEAFNIGSGMCVTINQVAETLKNIMKRKDLKSIYSDPRPGDVRHGYANVNKAEEILGYSPTVSLQEGLGELVKWYREKQS